MIRLNWLEPYASWCAKIVVVHDVDAACMMLVPRSIVYSIVISKFGFAYEWFACHLSQV
jgi:hypothetical protein